MDDIDSHPDLTDEKWLRAAPKVSGEMTSSVGPEFSGHAAAPRMDAESPKAYYDPNHPVDVPDGC